MPKMLDVPYRSQWDADANKSNTDCGPACLAMVLEYYGERVDIDEIHDAAGVAPGQYVGFGQLQRVARTHDLALQYGQSYKLNDLKRWIDERKPAIALVKYSYWSQIEPGVSTQDTFTGPHFVVVVGYGEGNVYVNDPNYWPPRRQEGHQKAWSEVLFNLAWGNVRTPEAPNPNNAVIVPLVGKREEEGEGTDLGGDEMGEVIEYTVQPGDSWSALAGRFYGDQTRYPEILAFNGLEPGASLFVGQKLRILMEGGGEEDMGPEQPIVLGEGATQRVDKESVTRLKQKWVDEGKLSSGADVTTVLRTFVEEIEGRESDETEAITYVVQPGDTWAGIAGRFYGDQMRYREIIEFNGLAPGAPLFVGQKLRIPPK